MSTTGIRALELKFERRVNFLKEGGIRRLLQEVGRDVVSLYTEKIQTFTPGEVADLSAKYKPTKERRFGRLYPIRRVGAMLASLYSRVYRGPPWSIRIGWAERTRAASETRSSRRFTRTAKGRRRREISPNFRPVGANDGWRKWEED